MEVKIHNKNRLKLASQRLYVKVGYKFLISHTIALFWVMLSVLLSIPWVEDFGMVVTRPIAIIIIAGISYIPGYINAFIIVSLLLDRQPDFTNMQPNDEVTIIIACRNEEKGIRDTLRYIGDQDYEGSLRIIVVDNASTDNTSDTARLAGEEYRLNLTVLHEGRPGKFNALNNALKIIDTEYAVTLDADTLLHKSAMRYIIARMKSAPSNVCAVAGAVLVRNSRKNFICKLQEWDYFLGIASIKRMQGLYQGTLVAQGAFSLYKTEVLREAGGWPDAIGEDIVLTWSFLKNNHRVFFEPLAVAFTDVPESVKHLARQRSRWARGMIEALRLVKPWEQPVGFIKYLTGINLIMPFLDLVYTVVWMPGLLLAMGGVYWVIGPVTLFVLPLALIQNAVLYRYQKHVFRKLNLKVRKNAVGFVVYVLAYQMLASPMSIYGYLQEVLYMKRIWK